MTTDEVLAMKLDEVDISVRLENILFAANCKTLGDVAKLSEGELFKLKNAGHKTVRQARIMLEEYGLGFAMKFAKTPLSNQTSAAMPTMTLRDAFALGALTGMTACSNYFGFAFGKMAEGAYAFADSMLAERERVKDE